MKIICGPPNFDFTTLMSDLNVILYGSANDPSQGFVGQALKSEILRKKVVAAPLAWDFLALAMAVVSADLAGHRRQSPDGWTREFELFVTVGDPAFWNANVAIVEKLLEFLTTDRWSVHFIAGGIVPEAHPKAVFPEEDCIVLLSGGLDSFVGAIDLVAQRRKPIAVSQTVRGDAAEQRAFAARIGGGLRHFQLNHVATVPNPETPPTQRARSIVFLAYGVFFATTLAKYHSGDTIPLYVCENGFISINPPLTGGRLGSLSTRTTHPVVLSLLQQLLVLGELRVQIVNPYRFTTKGEMLRACADQDLLEAHGYSTTSCGRFKQYGYKHCGRCLPCLVRRAAFHAWKGEDATYYVHPGQTGLYEDFAGFDDIRSALMGIAENAEMGTARWLGATLSSDLVEGKEQLRLTVDRGLREIAALLTDLGVQ